MDEFDPIYDIVNSSIIHEADGTWPCFLDSIVRELKFSLEDYCDNGSSWTLPSIEASIEIVEHLKPYIVDFKFHKCCDINMSYFNHQNVIEELCFSYEDRGFYADNKTPLPPYIFVKVGTPDYTVALTLKCFKVEVLGRRVVEDLPSA